MIAIRHPYIVDTVPFTEWQVIDLAKRKGYKGSALCDAVNHLRSLGYVVTINPNALYLDGLLMTALQDLDREIGNELDNPYQFFGVTDADLVRAHQLLADRCQIRARMEEMERRRQEAAVSGIADVTADPPKYFRFVNPSLEGI